MARRGHAFLLPLALLAACAEAPSPPPAASVEPAVVRREGMPRGGPGDRYNSCERVWCLVHDANFDLDHFTRDHSGWILHDDGHGDVFVPRHRTSGPEFREARHNVLLFCGQHVHPYWLGGRRGPVTRTGYNVALGYPRAHFRSYGTRLPPSRLNEQGWGFLHASAPREYRFGDLTTAGEMAGSGWQKAIASRISSSPPESR